MCKEEGCKTQPTHNMEGDTRPLYCFVHKKEGMVYVINTTCEEKGCKTQPTYNAVGDTKALYCSLHKKEGMVIVIPYCWEEGYITPKFYSRHSIWFL